MAAASSFRALSPDARGVARGLARAVGEVKNPTGGVVFVTGPLARSCEEIAQAVRAACPTLPVLVVAGSGVLEGDADNEGEAAATGMVFGGGEVRVICTDRNANLDSALAEALVDDKRATTLLLFVEPSSFHPNALTRLAQDFPNTRVAGAGVTVTPGAFVSDGEGHIREGGAVGFAIRGLARPRILAAPACAPLSPLQPITASRGTLVLELADEPALDVLTRCTKHLEHRPLILAMIARQGSIFPDDPFRGAVIRPIRGIDPQRKAIVVGDEILPGDHVGFVCLDPTAARRRLEEGLRALAADIAGSAPRFGVLFNCGGRGRSLYGNGGVDTKLIRTRFPSTPLAGLFSAFELASLADRNEPKLHVYTSVFVLFHSPS
jgi:small ligand-binding sensory domain FIST